MDNSKGIYTVPIQDILDKSPSFKAITRISALDNLAKDPDAFMLKIFDHVIGKGLPLIVEDLHKICDLSEFEIDTLAKTHGSSNAEVFNAKTKKALTWDLNTYIDYLRKSAGVKSSHTGHDQKILALKDQSDWVKIPSQGLTSPGEFESKIRSAVNLLLTVPLDQRPKHISFTMNRDGNWKSAGYSHGGTVMYNLMVDSATANTNKFKRDGSTIWFMTQTADWELAREYWRSACGVNVEAEQKFVWEEDLIESTFPVYITEQKYGELVVAPPGAIFQAMHKGDYVSNLSWHEMTAETASLSLNTLMPEQRIFGFCDIFMTKSVIFHGVKHYLELLSEADKLGYRSTEDSSMNWYVYLKTEFVRLYGLFVELLLPEKFKFEKKPSISYEAYSGQVTCTYCHVDIFNQFLTCPICATTEGEEVDICMDCYSLGRGCECKQQMTWIRQWYWEDLEDVEQSCREKAQQIQRDRAQAVTESLDERFQRLQKRTLADVVFIQMQSRNLDRELSTQALQRRHTCLGEDHSSNAIPLLQITKCHICRSRHKSHRVVRCTCGEVFCFEQLYLRFDLTPFMILCCFDWKCPSCRDECSCRSCFQAAASYAPLRTILQIDEDDQITDNGRGKAVDMLINLSKGNLISLTLFDRMPLQRMLDLATVKDEPQLTQSLLTIGKEISEKGAVLDFTGFSPVPALSHSPVRSSTARDSSEKMPMDDITHDHIPLVGDLARLSMDLESTREVTPYVSLFEILGLTNTILGLDVQRSELLTTRLQYDTALHQPKIVQTLSRCSTPGRTTVPLSLLLHNLTYQSRFVDQAHTKVCQPQRKPDW
jgi:hypothetical protein